MVFRSLFRHVKPQSISPSAARYNWPNDIAFYIMFRDVKPPEEVGKEEFNEFKVQGLIRSSAF